ncbi:hypothetical protein BIZ92_15680 [Achromobacter xylosoxidans]|uniref:Uncharacterized protein n=1 Tax=Alcaligenes xylosoxydans xylosoxydans TaxID=85698 RepID=A0A1R1JL30_ALCXX|nr:hypothetical protein BIZ92_15680 [Achromobacter xylosoxidans]
MMIHQPMSRHGGEPRKARRHDVDAIMAGAVFTAFVTGMQMGVVLDVQGNRFQDGQALPDQGDAVGGL